MKDGYDNKMMKGHKTKEIAVYIGAYSVWLPKFNRIVNPGDKVPGFSIDEAKVREDFITVKEY